MKVRLTKFEQQCSDDLHIHGLYKPASKESTEEIQKAARNFNEESKAKDSTLNMRINSALLDWIKIKANSEGMAYQTFIHFKLTQMMSADSNQLTLEERVSRLEKKLG